MWLVEHWLCACEGCGGHLEDGVWVIPGRICRSCRCMWLLEEADRFHDRRVARCPRYPGACRAADAWCAAWKAELDRQAGERERRRAVE